MGEEGSCGPLLLGSPATKRLYTSPTVHIPPSSKALLWCLFYMLLAVGRNVTQNLSVS